MGMTAAKMFLSPHKHSLYVLFVTSANCYLTHSKIIFFLQLLISKYIFSPVFLGNTVQNYLLTLFKSCSFQTRLVHSNLLSMLLYVCNNFLEAEYYLLLAEYLSIYFQKTFKFGSRILFIMYSVTADRDNIRISLE